MKKRLSREEYLTGILANDPVVVSKAFTLFESGLKEDALLTNELLEDLYPYSGKSLRLGISGVPGAGKSTFIEGMGNYLTSLGKKIAVITIDPSSSVSKGSILGDKTRMESLSNNPSALIRTSPSHSYLGGVTMHTRKLIVLCEAAGYEIIMIETVGTGQSETDVKQMTDFLILLVLSGAGDELQGMKKGIGELVNLFIVNKADGVNVLPSKQTQKQIKNSLHLSYISDPKQLAEVIILSSISNKGFNQVWNIINQKVENFKKSGSFYKEREKQNLLWMEESIKNQLMEAFYQNPSVIKACETIQDQVLTGKLAGIAAADKLIKIFKANN